MKINTNKIVKLFASTILVAGVVAAVNSSEFIPDGNAVQAKTKTEVVANSETNDKLSVDKVSTKFDSAANKAKPEAVEAVKKSEKKAPRTLTVKGVDIQYFPEIGQAGINANHEIATTWFGDYKPNSSTLIAGHDDGKMGIVKQLGDGDVVTLTDADGVEHQYKFVGKRHIQMVHDGQGSGYIVNEDDEAYVDSKMNDGKSLNLQTCVESHAGGYSIIFVSLEPVG